MGSRVLAWLAGVASDVPAATWAWLVWGRSGATCKCVFDGEVCQINHKIVDVLQLQLERCGPSQLSCPRAPACPPEVIGYSAGFVILVFVAGLLLGAGVSLALVRLGRSASEEAAGALGLVSTPSHRRRPLTNAS